MSTAKRWMESAGWVYLGVGLGLAGISFVPEVLDALNRLVVPLAEPDAVLGTYAGVAGGLVAGLGAIWIGAARIGDASQTAWLRALRRGLVVWYFVDSLASLLHGAWPNVVSNTVLLALGLLPILALLRTRETALDVAARAEQHGAA